jgi:glycosyltransferase involved in cell wall biosynthesis
MKTSNKITVSCGTKFHSDYMAYQLSKHDLLDKVLTSHPSKRYLNRVPLSKNNVKFLFPVFLVSYGLKKVFGNSSKLGKWIDYKLPVVYDRLAARSLKKSGALLTWAWSGLHSIRTIKKYGGVAIVEQCGSCNLFQNEILEEEYNNLGLKFLNPTPNFILYRQMEEAKLADYLLCPSKHVARSFVKFGIDEMKCKVIPYGANIEMFKPMAVDKKEFTILFVGSVGVRKGLIYLFKALELIKGKYPIRCIVIGRLEEQFKPVFEQYSHLFTYIPRVPHHELVNYYNRASMFVFPSLDEGMAYVQLEALACGLPVVCTNNSGGDSVIEEGVEGYVIPIRDPEAIAAKVEYLYSNPSVVKQMSENARKKALAFSWDQYGNKLAGFINSIK